MRFWIFLLFPFSLLAQTNGWQGITISDGLSQGMIYDLIQDRQGFLWFATKDGLNRYDGYNFNVFTHNPYNPFSISGNTCTALLEDTQGRIWVGTQKDGLNLYDPQTHRFYHANIIDKQLTNAGNYEISYLKEDKAGAIWIITSQVGKLFKIIPKQFYPPQNDFSDWVQTVSGGVPSGGVPSKKTAVPDFVFDKTSIEFRYSETIYQSEPEFLSIKNVTTDAPWANVIRDAEKRFWFLGTDVLLCIKGTFVKKITFKTPSNQRIVVNIFQDGTIAICNQKYVWIFKVNELLQLNELTPQNAFAQLPPEKDIINQLFKDQNGNVWVATGGYGLLKFNPRIKQFHSFLPQHSPSSLYQDQQGRVYVHGNYRPSYHFYELDKLANRLKPIPNVTYVFTQGHDVLLQDKHNDFWLLGRVGTKVNRSLKKYSVDWQLIKEYPLPPLNELKSGSFKLLQDSAENIWIGHTEGNLIKFNPTTEQFQVFSYHSLLPKSGAAVETFALYQDKQHTLWIGTQKGLIKAEHPQTSPVFSLYKNSKTDRRSLSEDFVSGMIDDPFLPDKYLWVSTKGGGLERLNKQLGIFEHFTEAQGLPNKVVYGILEGEDKSLWVSTNRGIARLNPKSLICTNFNKSDGLQDDEFNTNSYFKSPSGELLFGGVNGVTSFRPSAMGSIQKPPIIKIIGLKVNNKTVVPGDDNNILEKAIEFLPSLQLAHDENQVSLEFGIMDFTNPVKNRFRYQLEGIDGNWVETGTTRFANFTQLPSGSYTFRVQGSTNGEIWSQPVALEIRVNPPFYRTWWAYLLYLSVISYVIYRVYQNQLNRFRLQEEIRFKDKETERLAELDQLKTQFFTNISHEFRTPLTLILGPMEQIVKDYARDTRFPMMQRNAQRLLELINQLLDLGKLDARQMQVNLQPGDIARFIQLLGSSFQSLAENRSITFLIHQNQPKVLANFDADKMEKIIINLLSNAFKFSENGGRIEMSVEYSSPIGGGGIGAVITISDSGIGIDPEKLNKIFDRFYQIDSSTKRNYEGTGIGLALVKELVNLLKGTIQVESQQGVGTTFKVTIPLVPLADSSDLSTEEVLNRFGTKTETIEKRAIENSQESSLGNDEPLLLIVEDNDDLRAYIRTVFEEAYQVIEACDGQEGLEKATEFVPDIVISDLMMPRMDGFAFCKQLKSNEKTSHIPVVMLTAKATLEDRLEGFDLGADEYLVKPFNASEIKARVRNLIKIREKLRELFRQEVIELKPTEVKVNSMDKVFIQKAKMVIDKHISKSEFDVVQFAEEMNMAPVQLRRKLKALTNQTAIEFVRHYRLQRAADLLTQKAGTVSDIAFGVGFENLSYFARVFQEKYGVLPSDYPD